MSVERGETYLNGKYPRSEGRWTMPCGLSFAKATLEPEEGLVWLCLYTRELTGMADDRSVKTGDEGERRALSWLSYETMVTLTEVLEEASPQDQATILQSKPYAVQVMERLTGRIAWLHPVRCLCYELELMDSSGVTFFCLYDPFEPSPVGDVDYCWLRVTSPQKEGSVMQPTSISCLARRLHQHHLIHSEFVCSRCDTVLIDLYKTYTPCKHCNTRRYCSKACKTEDWKRGHRNHCL